ncbi:MAG: 2-hydroxyacid dehydrogenase [Dehalococcoidia bacterium]|nr:2-hydroxyacid dehydrogenase [Dehalococcoidia bacterium]
MAKPKIAIVSTHPQEQIDVLLSLAPPDMDVTSVDGRLSEEDKIAICKDVDAVILLPADLPVKVARACPRLKLIQTLSAGYDRLDLKAMGELGIPVANNGGANAIPVAEHAIGLMLMVSKKLPQLWYTTSKERKWRGSFSAIGLHDITGKSVGIVGLGRIGKQVARLLKGFDCKVVYHDVLSFPHELEKELAVTRVPFEELLRTSDIVTLHVPLTPLTRHMIGNSELGMMKPSAIIINTCRGPVVDEKALYDSLKAGRIAAAGLDVLEQEPTPVNNPLLDLDNVVVTPHMAGSTEETIYRSAAFAFENIRRVLAGGTPESIITPYY